MTILVPLEYYCLSKHIDENCLLTELTKLAVHLNKYRQIITNFKDHSIESNITQCNVLKTRIW